MTIRLDRVQRAAVATTQLLAGAGVRVLWAPSEFPRRTADGATITIRPVRGPLLGPPDVLSSEEATLLRWEIGTPVEDELVGLHLSGATWGVTATDDAEGTRDALLALFTGETFPGVEITADGTDSIIFDTDDVPGLLWRPRAFGDDVTVAAVEAVTCEVATASAELTLELQAFAAGRGMSALALLSEVASGWALDASIAIRTQWGVSLRSIGELIDITSIAGATWESRASMRIAVSTRSYTALPIGRIESVESTNTIDSASIVALAEG